MFAIRFDNNNLSQNVKKLESVFIKYKTCDSNTYTVDTSNLPDSFTIIVKDGYGQKIEELTLFSLAAIDELVTFEYRVNDSDMTEIAHNVLYNYIRRNQNQ